MGTFATALTTGAAILALSFVRPGTLSAQTLYATNQGNSTIEQFTPDGVASVFASTGLIFPHGLAFDTAGNLYAANGGNNTIERFTPDGAASLFASTGLSNPSFLAFDNVSLPVPEPSTWTLLLGLGGAGLLGFSRRQRRRAVRPG